MLSLRLSRGVVTILLLLVSQWSECSYGQTATMDPHYYYYTPLFEKMTNHSYWDTWVERTSPSTHLWTTKNNTIYKQGERFIIRGINFNGIESDCDIPYGLTDRPLAFYTSFLNEYGFNSVRIPIRFEIMKNLTFSLRHDVCQHGDPNLEYIKYSKDLLQYLLDTFHHNNISVIFNMKTKSYTVNDYDIRLINEQEEEFIHTWLNFIKEFQDHPAFMGIGIVNNHPYPIPINRYIQFCAMLVFQIENKIPGYHGLYFINGVEMPVIDPNHVGMPTFHGFNHPNLLCALNTPVDKFVLTPHVFGPSIRGDGVMTETGSDWEKAYGYISNMNNHWARTAILPTEWGGTMKYKDEIFYKRWLDWHVKTKGFHAGGYFWTLAPYYLDNGSIFNENYSVNTQKLEYINKLTL